MCGPSLTAGLVRRRSVPSPSNTSYCPSITRPTPVGIRLQNQHFPNTLQPGFSWYQYIMSSKKFHQNVDSKFTNFVADFFYTWATFRSASADLVHCRSKRRTCLKKICSKVSKFTINFYSWSHEQYISYKSLSISQSW